MSRQAVESSASNPRRDWRWIASVVIVLSLVRCADAQDPDGGAAAISAPDAFASNLFTGAATADIPIVTLLGATGVAPQIALRYNSSTVDERGARDQAQWTGLGWTVDVGGFIVRATEQGQDRFKLAFNGARHNLVLIDAAQNVYHTKDETFVRVRYYPDTDSWLLTTKDGVQHRFGGTSESRGLGLRADLTTQVTQKYFLDEVTTPSGVSVRYNYAKVAAPVTSTGASYDRAVYPSSVTYAYSGTNPIGPLREVVFVRAARTDWTDTSTPTSMAFFEQDRLEAIEVKLGGNLVRKYVLAHDDSIDRDPGYTWQGGATGDLTLVSVTQHGDDGTTALPALSFTYVDARLGTVRNSLGGTIRYAYELVMTQPLYSVCSAMEGGACGDVGVCTDPDALGQSMVLGHVLTTQFPGTVPVSSTCAEAAGGGWSGCVDWTAGPGERHSATWRPSSQVTRPSKARFRSMTSA